MTAPPSRSRPAWHTLAADDALQRLQSDPGEGLSAQVATRRLAESGPNALAEGRRRSWLVMFFGQFADFMILVLLAAAAISGFIGEPMDTLAIIVILVLNAVIGAVQEFRAERAVAALRRMAAPRASVVRDGHQQTIDATELVPGDVVLLESGSVVPADLRLLEIAELQTDESALTGESAPVEKSTEVLQG